MKFGSTATASSSSAVLAALMIARSATTNTSSFFFFASASHVVSGSESRLPMSLSSVVKDLEADGASRIATAAFLSSRSVTRAKRSSLLRSLFGITGDGDHDDEVLDGSTTAFGKKTTEEDEEIIDDEGHPIGYGLAVANPLPGSTTASEVAGTVAACGGTVVYVASPDDLNRGEGLFDAFAPAVERILAEGSDEEDGDDDGGEEAAESSPPRKSTLVVVVSDTRTASELSDAKSNFERAASAMLSSIVQPSGKKRASSLSDVFDEVRYVSDRGPVDGILCGTEDACYADPADIASTVASVVAADSQLFPAGGVGGIVGGGGARLASPLDLAAARALGPAARSALKMAVDAVRDVVAIEGGDDEDEVHLVPNFGELCDAAAKRALEEFDAVAGGVGGPLRKSSVARAIRSDLVESIRVELSDWYEAQLDELKLASFESFRGKLSKLRVSPNLASDMADVASESAKLFASGAKKLRASGSGWPSASDRASAFRTELKEYCADRLRIARASGHYSPPPRKGVTVGLHWLLPKPFGNDYRQDPWTVHARDNLIYVPRDKVTDVNPDDVKTGDWRRNVVPFPSGNEMIYLQ